MNLTLTDEEKEIVKEIYPLIKEEKYQKAFSRIAGVVSKKVIEHDASKVEINIMFDIVSFLEENGIDLMHNITKIPAYAFCCCPKLNSITICKNIKTIDNFSFNACRKLKDVKIEKGVQSIGHAAFANCPVLGMVTIPGSITFIDNYVFCGCDALQEVNYAGTKEQWSKIKKGNSWNEYSSIKTIKCSDGDIELNEQ